MLGVDFNADGIDEILEEEPFCSLSPAGMSRLRLRLLALSLWNGCDLKDMQLRSLDFRMLGDKPLKGGQVGRGGRGGEEGAYSLGHASRGENTRKVASTCHSPIPNYCARMVNAIRDSTADTPWMGFPTLPTSAVSISLMRRGLY